MRERLAAKLRPDRFTEMSPTMAAIVGYILGQPFTEPAIAEMVVTADGFVLARAAGRSEVWERPPLSAAKPLPRFGTAIWRRPAPLSAPLHYGSCQREGRWS